MENDNEVTCHEEGMKGSTEELALPLFTMPTLMSTTMPKTVPERIKDKNETSIDVTQLRYHPTSQL